MKHKEYILNGIPFITALMTTDIYQIALLIVGIISGIISIIYTIYKWYKEAIEDQEITLEELEQLEKRLKENANKRRNKI